MILPNMSWSPFKRGNTTYVQQKNIEKTLKLILFLYDYISNYEGNPICQICVFCSSSCMFLLMQNECQQETLSNILKVFWNTNTN